MTIKQKLFYKAGKIIGFSLAIFLSINIMFFILSSTKKIALTSKSYLIFLYIALSIFTVYFFYQIFSKKKEKNYSFLKGIKEGFKDLPLAINNIINTILLTILYFIGIGPIAIVMKLGKKRLLLTYKEKEKNSYWLDYNLTKEKEENYYRQF